MKKRDFIKLSLLGTASLAATPIVASTIKKTKINSFEALPHSHSIFPSKSFLSDKEITLHHLKYYKSAAKKLNNSELGNHKSRKIFLNTQLHSTQTINQAGVFFNHRIFFKTISEPNQNLNNDLRKRITESFGSMNELKHEFYQAAQSCQYNGWVWLVFSNNRLKVTTTKNNDNPIMNSLSEKDRGFPILTIDMWEHAYSGDYNQNKEKYIANFWNSINWDYVSLRHQRAMDSNLF